MKGSVIPIMKKIIFYENQETNYEITDEGKIFNRTTGKELKGSFKTNEYHSILLVINGKPKTFMVHRLVAEAFCENPNNYTIVDHINGDKHDERACNLRWVNASLNCLNKLPREKGYKVQKYLGDWTEDWKETYYNKNFMINKLTCLVVNKLSRVIMTESERNGYKRVHVGDSSFQSVHILMWKTFIGEIQDGYEIDHIDGNKANNTLDNLRLVNHSENMQNAYINEHKGLVKIYLFDLQGNFIAEFNSILLAADSVNMLHAAIKDASNRHGTSAGYYWLREKDKDNILLIINSWVPDGYKILKDYPTYCINKQGSIYNKRNKKELTPYYLADGVTRMVLIKSKRLSVDKLVEDIFSSID